MSSLALNPDVTLPAKEISTISAADSVRGVTAAVRGDVYNGFGTSTSLEVLALQFCLHFVSLLYDVGT